MKLPLSSFLHKKERAQYFLALLLREEKATAVIFEELSGKIRKIGTNDVFFDSSIEDISDNQLLDFLDEAISKAEENLAPNVETHKTVFGIKESWVENTKIRKEYLSKLKIISDQLNLSPIGFLVVSEAVSHLLQQEEGAPVSALLAETGNKTVTITLVKAGRIIETLQADIQSTTSQTCDALLKHFSAELLPSRFIILNGQKKDSEELIQEFIGHSWSKSLPFLHVPQIFALPQGFDAKSILFGAATQMGFEVLDILHDKPSRRIAQNFITQKEQTMEKIDNNTQEAPFQLAQEDFGFVKEHDVLLPQDTILSEDKNSENLEEYAENDNLIHLDTPKEIDEENNKDSKPLYAVAESEHSRKTIPPIETDRAFHKASFLKSIPITVSGFLGNLGSSFSQLSLPKITFPHYSPRSPLVIFVIPFLVILIAAGFFWYFFMLKAAIVITANPKVVQKNQDVTFSTTSSSDVSKNIIEASDVSINEDGSSTTTATGKKDTGNKAKGSVTMYNNNDSSKALSSGAILTSSNGLKFILDSDVTIASASGDIFSGTKPGTASTSITANTFGTEYNLPSDTKFSVNGSSTIAAKNDNPFSGGTKKQVTVVSKDDVTKLLTDLPKSLESKAIEDGGKKIAKDQAILPTFLNEAISKKDLDKNAGDEASSVTLKAIVAFDELSYKKDYLNSYLAKLLKNGKDDTFLQNAIAFTIDKVIKKTDKELTATLHVKGALLPIINSSQLAKDLQGKSFDDAKAKLEKIPQVAKADITLQPNIPFLPKFLPGQSKNISIILKKNE